MLCLNPAAWLSSGKGGRGHFRLCFYFSFSPANNPMADYNKYDPRVDSLVMESLTAWDPSVGKLSDEDKVLLARTVHQSPEKASKVAYFRSHTGFTREITVTVDDIARIYEEQTVGRR
jgi:hypothetical protein